MGLGLRRIDRAGADALGVEALFERSSTDTDGGGFPGPAMGVTTPATLPLRCSMRAFCFCFTLIIDRTCSIAFGLSRPIVNPMTTGEMGVVFEGSAGTRTSVLSGCGPPLIVTRRFFAGDGIKLDGGGAPEVS